MEGEEYLIERAKNDPRAFGELYDRYYPRIYGYIYRVTGNRVLSDDICSETFMKACLRLSGFRWKGVSVTAWLYRIATNELNQYFRRKRYRPETLADLSLFDGNGSSVYGESERVDEDTFRQLQQAVKDLPQHYRTVISLRYFEEMSIRDISEVLGKKEGTVKSLLSRGIEKLKNKLL